MNTVIPRHKPAFVGQIVSVFSLKPGKTFLDLTLGDGGHTEEALLSGAKVVSIDADIDAINRAQEFIPNIKPIVIESSEINTPISSDWDWIIIHGHFNEISSIVQRLSLPQFDVIWADLGTSQYQLANPERGFSFQSDAPLDMRLDQNQSVTAKDLVNVLTARELENLFHLGDEKFAKPIARAIVNAREKEPILSTGQLNRIITTVKKPFGKIHPSTKVFMALRMAVNLERESLMQMLQQIPKLVKVNGMIGVISFHSGEDRLVKHAFKTLISSGEFSAINHKPVLPSKKQLLKNRKIRSAKLRIIQKNY